MRAPAEHAAINRRLQAAGLGRLEEGGAVVAQLAFLVQGHDHFGALLMACDPELRSQMYDSMRPHLHFQAKPLEDYVIAARQAAERERLATIGANGEVIPFKVPEIRTEAEQQVVNVASETIAELGANGHLELVCRKCTRCLIQPGLNKADAIHNARNAGWIYDEVHGQGREICPKCA